MGRSESGGAPNSHARIATITASSSRACSSRFVLRLWNGAERKREEDAPEGICAPVRPSAKIPLAPFSRRPRTLGLALGRPARGGRNDGGRQSGRRCRGSALLCRLRRDFRRGMVRRRGAAPVGRDDEGPSKARRNLASLDGNHEPMQHGEAGGNEP